MNIPKSYEALAADLASEKIISKTLQGQKESYMMLADGRKFDLDAIQQRLAVAERRESEAREELLDLSRKLDVFYSRSHGIKNLSAIEDANDKSKALQQRLTVAEQRLSQVEGACDLAMSAIDDDERGANFVKIIQAIKDKAALKPAEEVEELDTRPAGCCCPPKGHTGIWAASMCPVHFGLKFPGVKP